MVISGASRGIGRAIALRFAAAGAHIVVITKDSADNIQRIVDEIKTAGGQALALDVDVRSHQEIKQAITEAVAQYGGIDALVNNTSATCFTNTLNTSPEEFDLLISTSTRAAFFLSQACLPHLKHSSNPHIINLNFGFFRSLG